MFFSNDHAHTNHLEEVGQEANSQISNAGEAEYPPECLTTLMWDRGSVLRKSVYRGQRKQPHIEHGYDILLEKPHAQSV